MFAILSVPFAFKHARNFKDYIFKILAIGIAYGIPVIIDMVAFKTVFKNARIAEKVDYISNIKNVVSGLVNYSATTFDILPNHFYQAIIFVIFFVTIVLIILNRIGVLFGVCNLFAIISIACVFSTATILQGSGWWATRVVYPIASIAGAFAINLFINYQMTELNIRVRLAKCLVMVTIGTLLVMQYFSFNKIYIDKYKINTLDENRYYYIGQAISDYQEKTGIEIEKIAFYNDAERTYPPYPNLYCQGDLIVSAFYTNWSDIQALNYYLCSNYEKIAPSDEYATYFASQNWDRLSPDQLLFEKDTLHICVY